MQATEFFLVKNGKKHDFWRKYGQFSFWREILDDVSMTSAMASRLDDVSMMSSGEVKYGRVTWQVTGWDMVAGHGGGRADVAMRWRDETVENRKW